MKRLFAPLVVLVLVCGLAAAWSSADAPQVGTEVGVAAPPPSPAPVASDPVSKRSGCHFTPGARLAYTLEARSTSRVDASSLGAGSAPPIDFSLAAIGTMELEVLRSTQSVAVLAAKLRVKSEGPALGSLGAPFLVEVGSDCQLTRFARSNDAQPSDARNQQSLLWDAQWRLVASSTPFQAEDGLGTFSGTFDVDVDAAGQRTSTRRLERYDSLWHRPGERTLVTGLQRVTPGEGPWFEQLNNRREVTVEHATITSTLSLWAVEPKGRFTDAERDEARFTWGDLLPLAPARAHVARAVTGADLARRAAVKHLTVTQAVEALTQRVSERAPLQDTWPELAAYFEVNPEAIAPAVDLLRGDLVGPDEAHLSFFIALGNARVPEARDALLEIKRDSYAPPMQRVRAMFSLVDRDDVGVPLAEELAVDAQALSSASTRGERFLPGEALLALSTMSGLRGDVAVSRVASASVRNVLLTALDPAALHTALKAVGNLGDPSLLDVAAPFSRAERVETRIAAASMFRRMAPQQSDGAALEWLARETHPFVKAELYDVIRSQHFDAQVPASAALANQALRDLPRLSSPVARKYVVRMVAASSIATAPATRAALTQQARWEYLHDSAVINEFTSLLSPEEVKEVLR